MSNETEELKAETVSDSQKIDTLKDEEKEKLAAAQEAYARKANVSNNGAALSESEVQQQPVAGHDEKKMAWLPGVILIGLGVIFLLNNVAGFELHNWWALFILIPAAGSFGKAMDSLRSEGELNREAWGAMAVGLIMTLVASAFLFNLDWGLIWPVFLIIGGLGIFLGALKSW